MTQDEDDAFEAEVRRIARIRFGIDSGGATIIDGQERDGLFVTDDCVHIVEATTSRKKAKAEHDADKIDKLLKKYRSTYQRKGHRGWFITRDDPTADQRDVFRTPNYHGIEAVSIHQFMAEIVDGKEYLSLRENHPFGSARNPSTDNHHLQNVALIDTQFSDTGTIVNSKHLASSAGVGELRALVIGDYGVGKSVALRELHHRLSGPYQTGKTLKFPLLLNLGDHQGQREPVEAIERHARLLGYPKPAHLVRAWKAGLTHLLLDGFDETSTMIWGGAASSLRRRRHASMTLIRKFIELSPTDTSIFLAGREHFFDSRAEMLTALGAESWKVLSLEEFDTEQVRRYLTASKKALMLPDWVPTRPLLLSYLLNNGFLEEISAESPDMAAGAGWDMLLDRLAERESKLEDGLDGATLRQLIESVATRCRGTADGVGPIPHAAIAEIFEEVCGYPPAEASLTLIQRLPGLGNARQEDGSRVFVDRDLAAAASAGDLLRYVRDPYSPEASAALGPLVGMDSVGIEVCAVRAEAAALDGGSLRAALERARSTPQSSILQTDLLRLALALGTDAIASGALFVAEVYLPHLEIPSQPSLASLTISDSMINVLVADRGIDDELFPLFRNSIIGLLEGRFGPDDIPAGRFLDCTIESYGESNLTSSAILESRLPMTVRVLLVCLRKLFIQKGSGRKESSFTRGVDHRARRAVPAVLNAIRSHGFAQVRKSHGDPVWMPSKAHRQRAAHILAHPDDETDAIVGELWSMDV